MIIYIGLLFISLFPSIAVTQSGIRYRSILAHGEVAWSEIQTLKHPTWFQGLTIIVIVRKGASVIHPKGLFINFIHGIWFGIYAPILLITESLEIQSEIVHQYKKNYGKSQ